MREAAAIATILMILAFAGIEPAGVQAKSCNAGAIAALLDDC